MKPLLSKLPLFGRCFLLALGVGSVIPDAVIHTVVGDDAWSTPVVAIEDDEPSTDRGPSPMDHAASHVDGLRQASSHQPPIAPTKVRSLFSDSKATSDVPSKPADTISALRTAEAPGRTRAAANTAANHLAPIENRLPRRRFPSLFTLPENWTKLAGRKAALNPTGLRRESASLSPGEVLPKYSTSEIVAAPVILDMDDAVAQPIPNGSATAAGRPGEGTTGAGDGSLAATGVPTSAPPVTRWPETAAPVVVESDQDDEGWVGPSISASTSTAAVHPASNRHAAVSSAVSSASNRRAAQAAASSTPDPVVEPVHVEPVHVELVESRSTQPQRFFTVVRKGRFEPVEGRLVQIPPLVDRPRTNRIALGAGDLSTTLLADAIAESLARSLSPEKLTKQETPTQTPAFSKDTTPHDLSRRRSHERPQVAVSAESSELEAARIQTSVLKPAGRTAAGEPTGKTGNQVGKNQAGKTSTSAGKTPTSVGVLKQPDPVEITLGGTVAGGLTQGTVQVVPRAAHLSPPDSHLSANASDAANFGDTGEPRQLPVERSASPPSLEAKPGEEDSEPAEEVFKPIAGLRVSIRPPEGDLPLNHAADRFSHEPIVPHVTGFSRYQPTTMFHWEAPAMSHQPLYFEEVNLERHGYRVPLVQPAVSAAHFFSRVPMMPYLSLSQNHRVANYTLGHYRPGSYAPYYWHYPNPSLKGASLETLLVVGIIWVFP